MSSYTDSGLLWLSTMQNADGSFGSSDLISTTSYVLLAFEENAFKLGYSPFDTVYPYRRQVISGLNYLFENMKLDNAGAYLEENSSINGPTGLALAAISASKDPTQIITSNNFLNGQTFQDAAQLLVDYLSYNQESIGGWGYSTQSYDISANNSVTDSVVLGFQYAQNPLFYFNRPIPRYVKTNLVDWTKYIQNSNGGAGFDNPNNDIDILQTANLIYEMNLAGYPLSDPDLQRALDYIANNWYAPACFGCVGWNATPVADYNTTFSIMMALNSYGITTLTQTQSPFNTIDWYADISSVLQSQQNESGSWAASPSECFAGSDILSTAFAVSTLQQNGSSIVELDVNKKSGTLYADVGSTIPYTLIVTNICTRRINNIIVSDDLTPNLSFVAGTLYVDSISYPDDNIVNGVNIGTLFPQQVSTLTFYAQLISLPPDGGIANSATAKYQFNC